MIRTTTFTLMEYLTTERAMSWAEDIKSLSNGEMEHQHGMTLLPHCKTTQSWFHCKHRELGSWTHPDGRIANAMSKQEEIGVNGQCWITMYNATNVID